MKSHYIPLTLDLDATGQTAAIRCEHSTRFSVIANIAFTTGVQTISFSSVPTVGTWTVTYDGNTSGSLAYNISAADLQTALRLVTGLGSVTVSGTAGVSYAVTMTGATASGSATSIPAMTTTTTTLGIKEVQLLTFPILAASTNADYVVITDSSSNAWAIALDKTSGGAVPSGAIYTAVNVARKAQADISALTTAAQVATAVKTAFEALASFASSFVITDNSNGTLTVTGVNRTNLAAPQVKNADDSGAGSITASTITDGSSTTITVTETTPGSEAPSGTLTVEASNDAFRDDYQMDTEQSAAIWAEVAGSSQTVSGAGVYAYNASDCAYRAFRLKFTRTEGNGTATVHVNVKGT